MAMDEDVDGAPMEDVDGAPMDEDMDGAPLKLDGVSESAAASTPGSRQHAGLASTSTPGATSTPKPSGPKRRMRAEDMFASDE
ncbi:hypothetical protein LTR53_020330, partial [Teratosphaeriaceae sp. CCFEE 6253]